MMWCDDFWQLSNQVIAFLIYVHSKTITFRQKWLTTITSHDSFNFPILIIIMIILLLIIMIITIMTIILMLMLILILIKKTRKRKKKKTKKKKKKTTTTTNFGPLDRLGSTADGYRVIWYLWLIRTICVYTCICIHIYIKNVVLY